MCESNNILYQAASVWNTLTDYCYVFTYGYKNQLYTINLSFSMEDFPHLAGFQYDYLCCSAFTKGERDYEANQRRGALLKKERIHIPTNSTTVLFDKLEN